MILFGLAVCLLSAGAVALAVSYVLDDAFDVFPFDL